MPADDVRPHLGAIRAERRRARRERLLFFVVSVIVLVATGVVTTLFVDGSGRDAPSTASALVETRATVSTEPTDRSPCRAPLTPDDPLRLWIGGDSLAGSLGPALGEVAAETGVVAPVHDSRSGSGLSTPRFFDWPEHAASEMGRIDPEHVVFIIGTNDWATPSASTETTTSTTSAPAWRTEYASRIEEMLEIFHGPNDRFVYWVGAPPLRDRRTDAGARAINEVAREVVALDEHAIYFDEYALFASESGGYTATIPRPGRSDLRVRNDDGIHFTDAGGEVLGEAVYALLDQQCRTDGQAVAGAAQPVVRVPGSSTGAGGSGGGGAGTTTSTTAAPATTTSSIPPSTSSTTSTTLAAPTNSPLDGS